MDVSFDGSSDEKWLKEDIETIRKGKAGRKVLAYLSIGEAEEYRPYWKKAWDAKFERLLADPPAPGPGQGKSYTATVYGCAEAIGVLTGD